MDLWIRSQNKTELIKVNNLKIAFYNGNYYIVTGIEEKELGKYCSYSRAKEILDEIQKIWDFKIKNESYEMVNLIIKANMLPKVYQMPEE